MPGQGRLGDSARVPLDAHGCPACPHPSMGPAIAGSPDVNVNGRPALRVDDPGIHAACCGTNTWTAVTGSLTVFINGKPAHRKGDQTRHCGGLGQLIEGSPNVIVGEDTAVGGGAAGGGGGGAGAAGGGGSGGSSSGSAGGEHGGGDPAGGAPGGGEHATGDAPPDGGPDEGPDERPADRPADPPPEAPVDPHELAILVVSALGAPLANVALDVTLPDGSRHLELTADDGSFTKRGIATTGRAHVVLVDHDALEDPNPQARTAGAVRYTQGGVEAAIGERTMIEVPPRVLRARLVGMLFDTDKTFLLPQAMQGIRALKRFYDQYPGMRVLVTGHADRTGDDPYNLELSADRARAIGELLTDQVDGWLPWYGASMPSKRWGTREDQMMLSVIDDGGAPFYAGPIDGNPAGETAAAIGRYQTARGLASDGIAGHDTRRSLITDYMAQDGTSLPPGTPLVTHGCGEHHPAIATPDGVGEEHNRRVEIFLFEDEIEPAPVDPCPPPGCGEYAVWVRRTLLTVDLDVPPGALTARVVDTRAEPAAIAAATVHLSGPVTEDGSTAAGGTARFEQLLPGTYTVLARKDGFETGNTTVTIEPGADEHVIVVLRPRIELSDARWELGDGDELALVLRDRRGRPSAGVTATIEVDGAKHLVASDEAGVARVTLPAGATTAVVRYAPPGELTPVAHTLRFELPPASEPDGAAARLRALGYPADVDLAYATFSFQVDRGLPATGTLDGETRAALQESYGA